MKTITPHSLLKSESEKSAIPLELFRENAIALEGDTALDYLLIGDIQRTNTGRIGSGLQKAYAHIRDGGGIWFAGWSLEYGYNEPWGVLKPIHPTTAKDGKLKKYETPPKYQWEKIPVFLPKPDRELEEKIRARFGNQNPDLPWDKWLLATDTPIAIVEGAKKAMSILATGLPAIGLYSLWSFANKTDNGKALKPEILALLENRSKAFFIVDNDQKNKQRRNAETAIGQLSTLVEKSISQIDFRIVDFGELHPEKGIDDLFASILNSGCSPRLTLADLIRRALKPIAWMHARKTNRTHRRIDYFVDSRFLEWQQIRGVFNIPEKRIIGIKSPKGTGKTEIVKSLVAENKQQNKKTIIITHRESLSRANAQRCGLPYWRDEIHINRPYGFGLCIDSLRTDGELAFNATHYKGCDVVIDEVDQVVSHLLTASTCRDNRIDIFVELKALVRLCDRLIVLDADLSSNTLEFLQNLYPPKGVVTIANLYKEPTYHCSVDLTSNPSQLVATALTDARNSKKLLILADSQKAKSKYSTSSLERLFKENSPAKVLRIDSETLVDPSHPSCGILPKINNEIKKYDIVICSPSVGTGISLDIHGYFDHVYGVFCGVLSPNSIRQFLLRLRDVKVPRSVFLPRQGLTQFANGSDRPEVLAVLQTRKWQATLQRYGVTNVWDEESDRLCSEFSQAFYRIAAVTNFERFNFRQLVLQGLESEGVTVSDFLVNTTYQKKDFLALIESNRNANYQESINRELNAKDLTEHEYRHLDKSDKLDKEEQAQIRKYQRKERYGIDVTEELIRLDDKGLYPKLKLLYYLGFDEIAENKDKQIIEALKGKVFLPDTERRLSRIKLEAFKKLGLDLFICESVADSRIWTNSDSQVKEIADRCRECASQIRDIFSVKINKDWSNIRLISHLLDRVIGLKLTLEYRTNYGGDRVRHYASAVIPSLYHSIFVQWLDRDISAMETEEVTVKS